MSVTIVVGLQWGDEGKGKIVDLLAQSADVVVRFNGGNNAGHTVINEFGKFALHLIPAGIFNPETHCLIERGVVIHLPSLLKEMDEIESRGCSLEKLKISPFAHLVMPWHIAEDAARDKGGKIGTTLRGIGPCYKDKAGRWQAFRVGDLLLHRDEFIAKFMTIYAEKQRELTATKQDHLLPDPSATLTEFLDARQRILLYIDQTGKIIQRALANKQEILLEGAQGTLLDVDYGTYPYVTSSNTTSLAACMLSNIPPREVSRIIGVTKAYTTRVGAGPFPTYITNKEEEENLRILGNEFGATTGRPRQCGWLDLPLLEYACRINNVTEIALTKIDVLGALPEVRLCADYESESAEYPLGEGEMWYIEKQKPTFETYPGWGAIKECRFRSDLPKNALRYVQDIERLLGTPIRYISTGAERKEIITL